MAKKRFEFSLQALLTLREVDKREVELLVMRLQAKLRRARENRERRQKKIEETGQHIRARTENLMSRAGERVSGAEIRERTRVLAELRADQEQQRRRLKQKQDVIRLFQGQLTAQEARRREVQAEIDELERLKQDELRKHKRELGRHEERERDEDQIQRQNRPQE